ncbi:MAG: hypothetical protein ACLFVW_00475 [Phycisphaerae bacterium]
MAKRKNTPALFEVISRSRERQSQSGLRVPTWMGGESREQSEEPAENAAQQQAPQPEAQPQEPATPQKPAGPVDEPMFSTSGGRLRVSLNYGGAIALSVVVVLLLGAAFAIGRATAGPGRADQSAVQADADAEQELGESSGSMIEREPGKHYLVIWDADAGAGLRSRAESIAEFFTARDEQAEVRTLQDSQSGEPFLAVWSAKGFNSPDNQAAENYRRQIQQLAREYRQEHSSIRFNPWYAPYQPRE